MDTDKQSVYPKGGGWPTGEKQKITGGRENLDHETGGVSKGPRAVHVKQQR